MEFWQIVVIFLAAALGAIWGNLFSQTVQPEESGPVLDANGMPEERTELDKRIGDYA